MRRDRMTARYDNPGLADVATPHASDVEERKVDNPSYWTGSLNWPKWKQARFTRPRLVTRKED